ncbi:MAG: hypothetical protein ABSD20_00025 [Terriglobales bacterium]|jgi:hypothetical protein
MLKSSRFATLIIGAVVLCSLAVMGAGLRGFHSADATRFGILLLIAGVAARFKVTLPGLEGSMSMNLPFILVALAGLSFGEALAVAGLSTLVQCLPGKHRQRPVQIIFNVCNVLNATGFAGLAFHQAHHLPVATGALLVMASTAAFFLGDTLPVSLVIAATDPTAEAGFSKVWREIFSLTFPYFVLSAGLAAIVLAASMYIGWYAVGVLPLMYGVYRSYQRYWSRANPMLEEQS